MKEFDKVIGYENVKIELIRIIDMMHNPKKYADLGVRITKNLIISGNPGVGKTLMAKCFIEASKRQSITLRKNAPDGDFIKKIKEAFDEAKKIAPSILFLDDIDKFANEDMNHRNTEEYVTIQSCIDEIKDADVFIIATTNCAEMLPNSLRRVGRFDKSIEIDNPCGKDAELIVEYYLKDKKVADDVDTKEIAKLLDGGSCATLETVLNEAGVYSGYENRNTISMDDIIRSFTRVVYDAPEELNGNDRKYIKNIATHEAGHALVSELLEPDSVNIVTVKRHDGDIGGFTSYSQDENYFKSMHFMENRVITLLAGKAATEIVYGTNDVGVNYDINRAFKIVDRFIDDYCCYGFQYWESRPDTANSDLLLERKSQIIQCEMAKYYQQAKRIIINNRDFLDKLIEALIDKETLVHNDIQKIKESCLITV